MDAPAPHGTAGRTGSSPRPSAPSCAPSAESPSPIWSRRGGLEARPLPERSVRHVQAGRRRRSAANPPRQALQE